MEKLINTDSVVVVSDAYIEGLHIKYDFYMNVIGIGIICVIAFFVLYVLIVPKNRR